MAGGGADADRAEGREVRISERMSLGVDEEDREEDGGFRASEHEERSGLDARERTWRELI